MAGVLAQHAHARHEQTLQTALAAFSKMASAGETVTVSALASRAGVSRSWIYTQPELRERIEQLRGEGAGTRPASREAGSRASTESLRRRLALAHQPIEPLGAENHQLRQSLARTHGQLRAARTQPEAALR